MIVTRGLGPALTHPTYGLGPFGGEYVPPSLDWRRARVRRIMPVTFAQMLRLITPTTARVKRVT